MRRFPGAFRFNEWLSDYTGHKNIYINSDNDGVSCDISDADGHDNNSKDNDHNGCNNTDIERKKRAICLTVSHIFRNFTIFTFNNKKKDNNFTLPIT